MDDFEMPSDFDFKVLSLIDVSAEDDCLIDSISPRSSGKGTENRPVRFSLDPGDLEISSGLFEEARELEEPPGSLQQDKTRKHRKNNLRKNFTWDNAFFASTGFLESEEWCSTLGGNENGEIYRLPGIQEDVNGSFESLLTLEFDSETLTLEDPEVDLFEDIRASIQKLSKTPNTANPSDKKAFTTQEMSAITNSLLQKAAPKKPNIGLQDIGKASKQSVTRTGESTSSSLHKLPKGLSRVGSISTAPIRRRRLSLGDKCVKMEKYAKSVTGRGITVSKTPALGSSRTIVPRTLSTTSCASPASGTTELINYCTLLESCASILSERIEKSSLNSIKQKNDFRKVNPSSDYTISNHYKNILKGKNQAGSSKLSTSLKSSTKLSSGISPASSITVESSEPLSSISAANQRSNMVKASLGTGFHKGLATNCNAHQDLDSENHPTGQCSAEAGVEVTGALDESIHKVSAETSSPLLPASMKLSSIRLRSTKEGFFDGVRSSGCSPKGNMSSHPGVLSGSPKSGAKGSSPTASSIRAKIGKLQPVRTLSAIRSPSLDVTQTSSLVRSRPSLSNQKPSNAATKVSTAPRNPKSSPRSSPKLQNKSSPRAGRESFSKVQGLGSAETIVVGGKEGARIKDTKIVPIDGLPQTADNLTSEFDVQLTLALEEAAEKETGSRSCFKTNTLSLHNTNQDEAPVRNSCTVEVDINSDTRKECISDYHFEHGQKELTNSLSNPTPCPVSSEITSGSRKPFSVKDSFYNIDAAIDGLSGTALVVDKTTVLPIPESIVPENS
ncbi:hypothetical protein HRI_003323100 [Hibiscus trionum]|uniref:Uncharacterized protein n=1 Tax=Hibiscus trionum TaxID=183268 RepID=A0A9W7IJQ0_HIBTR|nr:hypothetical protein HRI_003323100 [Hibiscus trionum]